MTKNIHNTLISMAMAIVTVIVIVMVIVPMKALLTCVMTNTLITNQT